MVSSETTPTAPHGGKLVSRVIAGDEYSAALELAAALPSLSVDARTVADLELIATGAYSPLTGFMGLADYQRVLHEMRLANGLPWSLPITLRVTDARTVRESTVRDGSAAARSSAAGCSSPAITRLTSVPPCAAIGVVSELTT